MRAAVQHTYGNADALRIEMITTPGIADNEVLVKVHAAGLNRGTRGCSTSATSRRGSGC